MDDLSALKTTLVQANRILLQHGVVDAFGHVSARHPHDPGRFLMARRVAPGLVREDDILEYDLTGELAGGDKVPVFLERFIHSEIYAARPDVQSVAHSHSPAIVSVGVVKQHGFRALCHTCGFLGAGVPNFEIRDFAGDATNLLISSAALGRALASVLGSSAVVLMRGHGSTAVGRSVAEACYHAVYAELNARLSLAAAPLGEITYLSEGEIAANAGDAGIQIERTWDYWIDNLPQRAS